MEPQIDSGFAAKEILLQQHPDPTSTINYYLLSTIHHSPSHELFNYSTHNSPSMLFPLPHPSSSSTERDEFFHLSGGEGFTLLRFNSESAVAPCSLLAGDAERG